MRIRTKLGAAILVVIAATAAAVSASLLWIESVELEKQALRGAALIMDSAQGVARESLLSDDPMILTSHLFFLKQTHPEIRAIRVKRGADWIALRRPGEPETPEGRASPSPHEARHAGAAAPAAPDPLVLARSVTAARRGGGTESSAIEVSFSRRELTAASRRVFHESLKTSAMVLFLVLLLALPFSFWAGSRITREIDRLGLGIERIAAGEEHRAIPSRSRDEIGQLIGKFNTMAVKLKEIDQMKQDFTSSITHDLKTPLNVIESYVNVLLDHPGLDAEGRDQLKTISESAQGLNRFVRQLLDAARIERGKMELHRKPADAGKLVRDVTGFCSPWARESGVELVCEAPEAPLEAFLDSERITQVLHNLISNGIKFTPSGGRVTVYARETSSEGRAAVEIGVADTGIGIAPEDQARLFKPFERLENAGGIEGTGLGMHIARTIIELHGSRLNLESAPGKGSRFHFAVRAAVPA